MTNSKAILLTFVGFAALASATSPQEPATKPLIPRWISADKHGQAYIISKESNGNSFAYEGYLETSWDFDYNCMRTAWSSYSDWSFGEQSYCNGVFKQYTSESGKCDVLEVGNMSLETDLNKWVSEFTREIGDGYSDPIWHRDEYVVTKHGSERIYFYMRPTDKVVEFIVDSSSSGDDFVLYFPQGLAWDQTVGGVWDYEHKYGQCPNNAPAAPKALFKSPKSLFTRGPGGAAPTNLAEKPRLQSLQIGGVRALFSGSAKTLASLPSKVPFQLLKSSSPKIDPDLEAWIRQEIDFKFEDMDFNRDGQISAQEVRRFGGSEAEVAEMMLIDQNGDGMVSKQELFEYILKVEFGIFAARPTNLFSNWILAAKPTSLASYSHPREAEVRREIDKFFQEFDDNRDGQISAEEVLNHGGKQRDIDEMQFIDKNGDTMVSKQELYEWIIAAMQLRQSTPSFFSLSGMTQAQSLYQDPMDQFIKMQVDELFAEADDNRDNLISADEVLRHGGTEDDVAEIRNIDMNGDRKVSKSELTAYLKAYYGAMGQFGAVSLRSSTQAKPVSFFAKSKKDPYEEFIALADTNQDGKLSKAEVKSALEKAGLPLSTSELDFIFSLMDSNNDGQITKSELENFDINYN